MPKSRLFGAVGIVVVLGGVAALAGQTPASPAFEVASVKSNKSGASNGSLRPQPGGRIDAVNMPLRTLITFAYQLEPFRLVGGPSWVATDRFDIVAKLEGGDPPTVMPGAGLDWRAIAMETLLADRFHLVVHHEMRDLDIFALVLAKPNGSLGPALKRSTEDCTTVGRAGPPNGASSPNGVSCGMRVSPGRMAMGGLPLVQFANGLSGWVGRVVVDRTGLEGNWDFEFAFAATLGSPFPGADTPLPSDPDAPSIFTAIQEQLGLKLESTKGPVDVLVIDHVERPTED